MLRETKRDLKGNLRLHVELLRSCKTSRCVKTETIKCEVFFTFVFTKPRRTVRIPTRKLYLNPETFDVSDIQRHFFLRKI